MKNSLEGLKSGFEQAAQITVNLKKKKPKPKISNLRNTKPKE